MKLSEIPFGSRVGMLVRHRAEGVPETSSDIGRWAVVEEEVRDGWVNMNVGGGTYAGCDPSLWDVVSMDEDRDVTHAFEVSKQNIRSAMDGFLLAMNAVRKRGGAS